MAGKYRLYAVRLYAALFAAAIPYAGVPLAMMTWAIISLRKLLLSANGIGAPIQPESQRISLKTP